LKSSLIAFAVSAEFNAISTTKFFKPMIDKLNQALVKINIEANVVEWLVM
jgi:hypothetical protein